MSFASPLWLLGLLGVPAMLAAYFASRRHAKRYAVRFTAVPTVRLAAGTVPAWRRHLPAALALAALAALVVSLAKPQETVAVAVQRASIMLVTDHSGSMEATDVKPNRLAAAQRAERHFLDSLPHGIRVGVVAFSDTPDAVQAPSADHDAARRIIDAQIADGATDTGDALQVAIDALRHDIQDGKRPPSAIVLISDGKTTTGSDPVAVASGASKLHIPIHTVALGASTPRSRTPTRSNRRSRSRPTPRRCDGSPKPPAGAHSPPKTPGSSTRSTRRWAHNSGSRSSLRRSAPASPSAD